MKKILLSASMLLSVAAIAQAQTTVNLETAGTLSSKISSDEKYTITDLTITGELNGSDFVLLRDMAGQNQDNAKTEGKLEKLDISGATIVAGGDPYYVVYGSKGDIEYKTSDKKMGNCLFANCPALKTILMPTNTTAIGDSCFFKTTALENVTYPESITEVGRYAFAYTKITGFVYPSGVELKEGVFRNCSKLTTVVIPDNLYDYS